MGLKLASIKKAVTAAFTASGEVVSTATYRRTVSTYTPATGAMVKVDTDYTIQIILVGFSNYEINRTDIQAFDMKGMVEQKNLSITPNPATDTVLHNSKIYSVIRYVSDPAGAVYTLHLRAP